MNSCAPNVTVVNVDNGFGAGYVASLINRGALAGAGAGMLLGYGLARALEAAGDADSATVVWERYLDAPDPQRIEWDPFYLGIARERLILRYTEAGRTAEAEQLRRSLTRQWTGADPTIRARLVSIPGPG